MKKLLYFGLCICTCLSICFCTPLFASVKAEDSSNDNIIISSSSDFFSLFSLPLKSGQKLILDEDLIISTESIALNNRNLNSVEFDGQGHTIVTSYPLFNIVDENSVIKNLNVIASKNFVYSVENSNVSSFGLVACDVQGANVFNVCASCEIAPTTESADTYGVLNLNFNGSTYIGGMFGQLRYGAVVQNCYSQTSLIVTQQDSNATTTVVGGFVGNVDNVKITNCYVIPVLNDLISFSGNGTYCIGGFAGQIGDNVQSCVNVFTGGNLPVADVANNKIVGKIFGKIGNISNPQGYLKISKCYSYNQSSFWELCGEKSLSTQVDIATIALNNLKSISTFYSDAQINDAYIWDGNYEWDTSQTWCKKEIIPEVSLDTLSAVEKWKKQNYDFPLLQIFQDFTITISKDSNSLGVDVSIVNDKDEPLLDQKFSYGTKIYIKIDITNDYLPYKVIESLKFNNQTYMQFNDNAQTKKVMVVVSAETAGSYYVTTKNISYYLNVKSESTIKGTVRYKDSTQNLSENQTSRIEFGSALSFTAVPASVSYAFEKWVWLDENGDVAGDAVVGEPSQIDAHLAQRSMTILFGDNSYSSKDYIYLYLTQNDENLVANNIPYKTVDGKRIFTIQAKFSTSMKELSVYVNAPSDACQIYIGGTETDGVPDDGMYFTQNVISANYIKLKIEVSDEYKFVGWSSLTDKFNINDLIDKKYSNANSTEIYVKITEPVTLYAQVSAIEESKTDLTWLWITLGGLGGAGLITLIVVLAVTKKKNESFVRYY